MYSRYATHGVHIELAVLVPGLGSRNKTHDRL